MRVQGLGPNGAGFLEVNRDPGPGSLATISIYAEALTAGMGSMSLTVDEARQLLIILGNIL